MQNLEKNYLLINFLKKGIDVNFGTYDLQIHICPRNVGDQLESNDHYSFNACTKLTKLISTFCKKCLHA